MMPPLIGPTVKQADGFITDNNYTIYWGHLANKMSSQTLVVSEYF